MGLDSGYKVSTIKSIDTPIVIEIAADTSRNGRALFRQFTRCHSIVDSSNSLLKLIQASVDASSLHGFWVHSHCFLQRSTEQLFWRTQGAIIRLLAKKRSLSVFVARIHSECDQSLLDFV